MIRLAQRLALVAIAMLATRVAAQERPHFSGRWAIDAPAPAPGRGGESNAGSGARPAELGSGWGTGAELTITQDMSTLTVEYLFFGRGDMQPPLRFMYALDGSATTNAVMMGRGIQKPVSRTRWDGAALVITTVETIPGISRGQPVTSEVKQVLSLLSPTSMRVETTRSGVLGGPASTTVTMYVKR